LFKYGFIHLLYRSGLNDLTVLITIRSDFFFGAYSSASLNVYAISFIQCLRNVVGNCAL